MEVAKGEVKRWYWELDGGKGLLYEGGKALTITSILLTGKLSVVMQIDSRPVTSTC